MKRDWKGMICMTLLAAMLLPGRVLAESGDGFRLDSSGQVTLDSGHAAKEGISSLCFCLTVEAGPGDTVAFEFAGSNASISEYRHNENDKTLNIYMAGTDPLFAGGAESLDIGRVVVRSGDGGEGSAVVGVTENSLQYVYGAEARTMEGVSSPEAVQLGTPASTATPLPDQTPPPAVTQEPGGETGEGDNSGWQPPADDSQTAGSGQTTGSPQSAGSNKTAGSAQSANGRQPSAVTPGPETTPEPSQPPVPSPEPEAGREESEPLDESGTEGEELDVTLPVNGAENRTGAGDGFWEAAAPFLIGFAVAASVTGAGAAAVIYLIKGPKRRR